jgi:hypothetical protein
MGDAQQRSQGDDSQTVSPSIGTPRPEDVQKRFDEAYYNYVKALQEAGGNAQQRSAEAYYNYVKALQEAGGNAQQRSTEAYYNYVKALQEAWLQVDVNAVDVSFMTSLGQSMIAAAFWARGTTAS